MIRWAGPGQNSPSESTPDPKGVEFVKPEDEDYFLDCLIQAGKRAIERLRAEGRLPEQQEPKPKDK
jgi:hypothetical protein